MQAVKTPVGLWVIAIDTTLITNDDMLHEVWVIRGF